MVQTHALQIVNVIFNISITLQVQWPRLVIDVRWVIYKQQLDLDNNFG